MSDTLFKEVHYWPGRAIGLGRTGLTGIQRPFAWATAKGRDLFDLRCRGCLVGYAKLASSTNP